MEIAKSARANLALKVIEKAYEGQTISSACKSLGLPRSSFYYIIQANPQYFVEAQELIRMSNMEQLAAIVLSKVHIIERIIQDGKSEDTSPKDRIAILRELDRQLDKLMESLQLDIQDEAEAVEFLKQGPQTTVQESRLSVS